MKLFSINRKLFTYIGLCEVSDDEKGYKPIMFSLFGVALFTILLCASISSVYYIVNNEAIIEGKYSVNSIENSIKELKFFNKLNVDKLYAVFGVVASLAGMFMIVSTAFHREGLSEIFLTFHQVYDSSKTNLRI